MTLTNLIREYIFHVGIDESLMLSQHSNKATGV